MTGLVKVNELVLGVHYHKKVCTITLVRVVLPYGLNAAVFTHGLQLLVRLVITLLVIVVLLDVEEHVALHVLNIVERCPRFY